MSDTDTSVVAPPRTRFSLFLKPRVAAVHHHRDERMQAEKAGAMIGEGTP